jgi:hypothetical protein
LGGVSALKDVAVAEGAQLVFRYFGKDVAVLADRSKSRIGIKDDDPH